MYDINMLGGGGHPAIPPVPHHPHHPHGIPHPHPHMLSHHPSQQQQHPHPHAHPLQHQMPPHTASANRVVSRHHFEGHRGGNNNSMIPPPGSNGVTHGLGLTTTSSGNSGITTFYRTLSADNKPTTVVIGPSKILLVNPSSHFWGTNPYKHTVPLQMIN